MKDYWHPDCLRAMFDKITDHGSDMMVAQIVIPRNFNRMDVKTVNVIVKTNRQRFSMVCNLIHHRIDLKMFKTLH